MTTSIAKYLNQAVSVISLDTNTRTASGARTKSATTLQSNVKARITKNSRYNLPFGTGAYYVSTHLIFVLYTVTVSVGNYIKTSGGEYYKIEMIDDMPGGVLNNHKQLYCNRSEGISDA